MKVFWLEQSLADIPRVPDWLSGHDLECLSGLRVPKRSQDWRLGRWTAKNAVAAYLAMSRHPATLASIQIRPAASGAPEVFFNDRRAPVSISLSHREGRAACALAACGTSLGCDLEFVEPRSDAFIADYFTANEQQSIAPTLDQERFRRVALLWSAKESVLKALSSGLRVDPRSIEITFPPELYEPAATEREGKLAPGGETWRPLRARYFGGDQFHGWYQSDEKFVRTLISAPVSSAPALLNLTRSPAT